MMAGAGRQAVNQTAAIVQGTLDGLGQIITGRRSVKDLGGPLKIARKFRRAAEPGLAGTGLTLSR